MGTQTEWDHGGRGGGDGGSGRGSHVNEADGGARGGRTVGECTVGQLPTSTLHRGSGSPGGGETAGQHRWEQHLSEDTNKVEMVKAMGHGAGKGQAKYSRRKTRKADEAGGVRGASEPLSGAGGADCASPQAWGR